MPSKPKNVAAIKIPKNFSIEDRVFHMIEEEWQEAGFKSRSDLVNSILKEHFGIIN